MDDVAAREVPVYFEVEEEIISAPSKVTARVHPPYCDPGAMKPMYLLGLCDASRPLVPSWHRVIFRVCVTGSTGVVQCLNDVEVGCVFSHWLAFNLTVGPCDWRTHWS